MQTLWQEIYDCVCRLVDGSDEVQVIQGSDFIGMPPEVLLVKTAVYEKAGHYKLSYTMPGARDEFTWMAEITITDPEGELRHYLLRQPPEIVETYGRKTIEIDTAAAADLSKELKGL